MALATGRVRIGAVYQMHRILMSHSRIAHMNSRPALPKCASASFSITHHKPVDIQVRHMSVSPTKKARRAAAKAPQATVNTTVSKLTVALVGRPNAGKSRLFNRLVGRKVALVDATPGTTRDWKEEEGHIGDLSFVVMDTGGLEHVETTNSIAARMRDHTREAIKHANVVLYLFDAREGITDEDEKFVRWLKQLRPNDAIYLVANKAEVWDRYLIEDTHNFEMNEDAKFPHPEKVIDDCLTLGLGYPIAISAEAGTGLGDLYNILRAHHDSLPQLPAPAEAVEDESGKSDAIKVAIVGRPNVGKSSLVNYLVGEERVLAGSVPGLTRDVTKVILDAGDAKLELVDTAGMRRWGAWDLTTPLEGAAVGAAKRALNMSNVVVLVIDASGGAREGLVDHSRAVVAQSKRYTKADATEGSGMTRQDMSIAEQVLAEGRCLVVVANKIDTVDNPMRAKGMIEAQLENMHLGQSAPVVPISSIHHKGKEDLLAAIKRVYQRWNISIGTSRLNTWMQLLFRHHPPPAVTQNVGTHTRPKDGMYATRKAPIRVKFISQVSTRPPSFKLFTNRPEIPDSYMRFLVNSIRQEFDLSGVPIRLNVQASHNPYKRASADTSKPDAKRKTMSNISKLGAKRKPA